MLYVTPLEEDAHSAPRRDRDVVPLPLPSSNDDLDGLQWPG
jgi:hypothetical protein